MGWPWPSPSLIPVCNLDFLSVRKKTVKDLVDWVFYVYVSFLQASKKALDPVAPVYKYCLISVTNILTTTCQYEVSCIYFLNFCHEAPV